MGERTNKSAAGIGIPSAVPMWYGLYEAIRKNSTLQWQRAMYVAWAVTPKQIRYPKTQKQLAEWGFGYTSDRAFRYWEKNDPEVERMIAELRPVVAEVGFIPAIEVVNVLYSKPVPEHLKFVRSPEMVDT